MDFIENIRVSLKRAEAGICAEQNRPSAIFDPRIILRVGVAKDPPAERDKFPRAFFRDSSIKF